MFWWIVLAVVVLLVAASWARRRSRPRGDRGKVDQASLTKLRRDSQTRGFENGF